MKSDYISNQFKANAIEVILPNKTDIMFIDEVRQQIYNNTETNNLIEKYHAMINTYTENNPVILS